MSSPFPIVKNISADILHSVLDGTKPGFVIQDFANEDELKRGASASQLLSEAVTRGPALGVSGPTIGSAGTGDDQMETYLASAPNTVNEARAVFGGYSPIDRLLAQILEIYPPGLKIPQRGGRRYASQHFRFWKDGGEAVPHRDSNTTSALNFGINKRLACNVFIECGREESGALELFERLEDAEYLRLEAKAKLAVGFGLSRDDIGSPRAVVVPQPGSLIIFDANIVHAVAPVIGCRTTNSCFLGYVAANEPFLVFA